MIFVFGISTQYFHQSTTGRIENTTRLGTKITLSISKVAPGSEKIFHDLDGKLKLVARMNRSICESIIIVASLPSANFEFVSNSKNLH